VENSWCLFAPERIIRYHRAALAFNAHIGLEKIKRQETSIDVQAAAWGWVQEYRAEVAGAALRAVQGNQGTGSCMPDVEIVQETRVTSDSSSSTQGTQPKEMAMGKDDQSQSSTPVTGLKGKSASSVEDSMMQAAVLPCHSNTVVSCPARSGHEEEKNGVEGKERKEPTPS
jgi:hypothetical protein